MNWIAFSLIAYWNFHSWINKSFIVWNQIRSASRSNHFLHFEFYAKFNIWKFYKDRKKFHGSKYLVICGQITLHSFQNIQFQFSYFVFYFELEVWISFLQNIVHYKLSKRGRGCWVIWTFSINRGNTLIDCGTSIKQVTKTQTLQVSCGITTINWKCPYQPRNWGSTTILGDNP